MADLQKRLHTLLDRLEPYLPPQNNEAMWQARAFRWRRRESILGRFGFLQALTRLPKISMGDLHGIDMQKAQLIANTQQFLTAQSANHVLLTGARGTGKSSLIKACLQHFSEQGLRLVELGREDLADMVDIIDILAERSERFILFCDDLSFERDEPGYKVLKSILDGGLLAFPDNVLVYATSNRRHLIPEYIEDNAHHAHTTEGEIHPGDAVEEKISLSERFGLWLSFYPPRQEEYLAIVHHWLQHFNCQVSAEEVRVPALTWALEHGSRSGRVAWQFACDYAGKQATLHQHN